MGRKSRSRGAHAGATPAIRVLDQVGLPYETVAYTHDERSELGFGLEAAAALEKAGLDIGIPGGLAAERAAVVRVAVERAFAPAWGRHMRDDDIDAAIALVGPPFTRELSGAREARADAVPRMRRRSGGVAPGASWRDDGVSWTPETALLAWSAVAQGRPREAGRLLEWLDSHRTALGALPEKVSADGAPAGPAPLAWTCALVVLAVLEEGPGADRPS